MKKLVCGVGINDVDYSLSEPKLINGKKKWFVTCPFYKVWQQMLERCYGKKHAERNPSYVGCSVVEEWFRLSTFKAWMEQQDWEGNHLDKDLLVKGNKVYGPDTCVFISAKVNTFMTENKTSVGEHPVGVSYDKRKKKFSAQCNDASLGRSKHLGYFTEPQDAHVAWLAFKLTLAKMLASEQTDERVAKALIDRYENYALTLA